MSADMRSGSDFHLGIVLRPCAHHGHLFREGPQHLGAMQTAGGDMQGAMPQLGALKAVLCRGPLCTKSQPCPLDLLLVMPAVRSILVP